MGIMTRVFGNQARKPTGLLGKLLGRKMEKMTHPSSKWAIDLLHLQPADRVLEVGFGTGALIEMASEYVTEGLVTGIDYSPTMVRVSSKRNGSAIKAGRVELHSGDADNMPFADGHFDKVYAFNVIYLWPDLRRTLSELRRVLRSGGQLVLYLAPKAIGRKMGFDTLEFFTMHTVEDVSAVLTDIGFGDIRIERKEMQDGPAEGIVATK